MLKVNFFPNVYEDDETLYLITDQSPFYVEMGGQQGDTGTLNDIAVNQAIKIGDAIAHVVNKSEASDISVGDSVTLSIDGPQRRKIEAHHSATHLLHWALHEVISEDASQQGSKVSPDRLRFDFSSGALSTEQIDAVEAKVNSAISENGTISWKEVPHVEVKDRSDITQFFGDKYGKLVRVVQIGGNEKALDGYSMELCGGAHVDNTSEIGLFIIKSEGPNASGVRRMEAACGDAAWDYLREEVEKYTSEEKDLKSKLAQLQEKLTALEADEVKAPSFPHIMSAMLAEAKDYTQIKATYNNYLAYLKELKDVTTNADKALKKAQTAAAAQMADQALAELLEEGGNIVQLFEGPASLLQELLNGCKKKQFTQAAFFVVDDGDKLHLGALSGSEGQEAGHMAGKLIQSLAPIAGGKGGGKPDMARGAAPQRDKAEEILSEATDILFS